MVKQIQLSFKTEYQTQYVDWTKKGESTQTRRNESEQTKKDGKYDESVQTPHPPSHTDAIQTSGPRNESPTSFKAPVQPGRPAGLSSGFQDLYQSQSVMSDKKRTFDNNIGGRAVKIRGLDARSVYRSAGVTAPLQKTGTMDLANEVFARASSRASSRI